jgi:hypothetical protein
MSITVDAQSSGRSMYRAASEYEAVSMGEVPIADEFGGTFSTSIISVLLNTEHHSYKRILVTDPIAETNGAHAVDIYGVESANPAAPQTRSSRGPLKVGMPCRFPIRPK